MWALDNRTPYGAERNWIRDKHGAHHWVVCVKATFDVQLTGQLKLADKQTPPLLEPEYHGKPGASSLRLDSDLLLAKPCTDIVLDACAHAPRGQRTPTVPVALRAGNLLKQLLVHGERRYTKSSSGVVPGKPQPFTVQPIRYEAAFGGSDTTARDPSAHAREARNPIGLGFALKPETLVNTLAHTVEYANAKSDKPEVAGLGPIDRSWSPRIERAGTYDDAWTRTKKPLLPDDYDELFGSSAPADQRASEHLRGGEVFELRGMTPEGVMRFQLPKIYLTFSTRFGARRDEHRSRMTTVFIEPEARRVAVVWQSVLEVAPDDDDYLDKTVIAEKPYLA